MAEQLGGFVRMAAVLPEGVADQGSGIGGEGVAGYLKAALPAQAAGQYGGDGLEGAVLAPAHAPFLFGLLRLFDPCAGFGLSHGVASGFGLPEVVLGLLFLPLGFFGPVAAVGLGGTDDVGAGLGDGALPLQQALQVGQCGDAFVGAVQLGADAECLGTGTFAANADVAFAQYGVGGALAAAAVALRQAGVVLGAVAVARFVVGVVAVAAGDGGALGGVVAVVVQVLKGEVVGGEFVVLGRSGGGDGAAFEVHLVGPDVITALAGKQAALFGYAAAAAAGLGGAVVAAYLPGGAEGDLHTHAALALFAALFELVLQAFYVQAAADMGINAFGFGTGAGEGGVSLAVDR